MSTIVPPSLKSPEKTYKSKSKSKSKNKSKGKDTRSKEKNTNHKTALSSVFVASSDSDSDVDVPTTTTENATDSPSLAPPGYVRVADVVDAEEFDYDALKDNGDLELWVVRVPDEIKPKHLSNTSFSLPPPRSVSSLRLGTLERKNASYDFWSLPQTPHSKQSTRDEQNAEDDDVTVQSQAESAVGGDELLGLTCLVPRRKKKDGKLFIAPKPITHHIILSAQPALPTPPPSSLDSNHPRTSIYKSPARYSHPSHLLKHRFVPTGALHTIPGPAPPKHSSGQESMDVDAQTQTLREEKDAEVEGPSQKKKKRKTSGEVAMKKARKAKTAS